MTITYPIAKRETLTGGEEVPKGGWRSNKVQ